MDTVFGYPLAQLGAEQAPDDQCKSAGGVIHNYNGAFQKNYNNKPFIFEHELHDCPLIQIADLTSLAQRLERRGGVYWSNGNVDLTARWEAGTRSGRSLTDTMENIHDNESLVMLRFGVHDEVAGPILRGVLTGLIDLLGPTLRDDVLMARATILIAAPRRVTAYHVDGDTNFLFQLAGSKSFSVFDQTDRTLMTHAEIERYFSGDNNAARFKPDRQPDATVFALAPGLGVHVPVLAPHWAQNGDDVSVAVSFNFDLRSVERVRHVHKLNHRLRRFGLNPPTPDAWTWKDRSKLRFANTLGAMRRIAGRGAAAPGDGWVPTSV